jgi:hypothetical protein
LKYFTVKNDKKWQLDAGVIIVGACMLHEDILQAQAF